jgi:hypothetical protein
MVGWDHRIWEEVLARFAEIKVVGEPKRTLSTFVKSDIREGLREPAGGDPAAGLVG